MLKVGCIGWSPLTESAEHPTTLRSEQRSESLKAPGHHRGDTGPSMFGRSEDADGTHMLYRMSDRRGIGRTHPRRIEIDLPWVATKLAGDFRQQFLAIRMVASAWLGMPCMPPYPNAKRWSMDRGRTSACSITPRASEASLLLAGVGE
jgi:hypothetical protein